MSNTTNIVGKSSIDSRALADLMQAIPEGEVITYKTLSQHIGRDVTVHRHLLESARSQVMRDKNMVFGTVLTVGLKRLADIETISFVNEHRRKRIRSQAKKALRELSTVTYATLPRPSQVSHNAGMAIFGALHEGTETTRLNEIESLVANNQLPDASETLRLVGWISE